MLSFTVSVKRSSPSLNHGTLFEYMSLLLQLTPRLSGVGFRRRENEAVWSNQEIVIEELCDFLILDRFLCFFFFFCE